MRFASLVNRLRQHVRNLWRAEDGNVAIIFTITLIPIIALTGGAIDYSRASSVKTSMQAALDATALAMSKEAATLTESALNEKAAAYFAAAFDQPDAQGVKVTASYSTTGGSSVTVTGSGSISTTFMGIIGINEIPISSYAKTAWGMTRLRVALALDNTGSMASAGKMTALKTATKNLLTQLQNAAGTNGDVYVSIIPFSKDVNVGSGNYTAGWIDWTDWDSNNGSYGGGGFCYGDWCWVDGQWVKKSWVPANHNTWNGCITDRDQNYDRTADAPTGSASDNPSKLFPSEQYGSCPVQMMGLSYNWTAMNSLVDQMSPAGNTNQPIGLVWAWQSLVGGGPLTAPAKDPNYQYTDVIILMSDGLNTQNRWSTSQTQVDKRMYDSANNGAGTCANIKAAGITIYTIHVNTDGDPMSTLLQNCASTTEKFWMVTSSSGIGTVFNTIGTNLTKLRIAQ